MANDKNLKGVYETLKREGYNPPAFDDFVRDMQEDDNLRGVHATLTKSGYTPPEYGQFKIDMLGNTAVAQKGADSKEVSSSSSKTQQVAPQFERTMPDDPYFGTGKWVMAPEAQQTVQQADNATESSSQKGWQPTEQDKIRMTYNINSMMSDFNARSRARVEKARRVAEGNTTEGRKKLKAAKFQAQLAGTPTKVMGLTPDVSTSTSGDGEGATGEQAKPLLSGQGPVPYGVVEVDGQRKTQWLLPDGSLTTDFAEADKAEYGARRVRLMNQFVDRMKANGLDPSKQEDVQRQAQLDYEAPIRKAIAAAIQADDERSDKEQEAYMSNPLNMVGGVNAALGHAAVRKQEGIGDLSLIAESAYNSLPSGYRRGLIASYTDYFTQHPEDTHGKTIEQAATDAAKSVVYGQVHEEYVKRNGPQSDAEFFVRKMVELNPASVALSGTINPYGQAYAELDAMQRYGADHRGLSIAGTVAGMAIDPITYLGGWVGKGAFNLATRGFGKMMAKKAIGDVAGRYATTTLAGRIIGGVAAGGANFGTFEAAKDAERQLYQGGYLNPETQEMEGFSFGSVLNSGVHGVGMGAATGVVSPLIGNVADTWVKATTSTAGKVALRAGETVTSKLFEGTIFAAPDVYAIQTMPDEQFDQLYAKKYGYDTIEDETDRAEARKEARNDMSGDAWNGSMAMMMGFGASHLIKTAPSVIRSLRPVKSTGDRPLTREERIHNNKSFAERIRERMDQSPADIAMTAEEREELKRRGYGELSDLFAFDPEHKSRKVNAAQKAEGDYTGITGLSRAVDYEARPEETGNPTFDGYEAMERLMEDESVSEATRAKAYYILTGRNLPMSTVTGWSREDNEDGTITITSHSNRGNIVTSRSFSSEKEARREIDRIERQSELNTIDIGEQYRNVEAQQRVMEAAIKEVSPGADLQAVYNIYEAVRRGDKNVTEEQRNLADLIDEAIERNTTAGDEVSPAGMREHISQETGVDIDKAIRKEPGKRTEAEQEAVNRYTRELFPEPDVYEPTPEEAEADRVYEESRLLFGRFEQGDPEAQAEIDAISLRMTEAHQICEDAFGDEAEVRMAEIKENPWATLNDPELTSDQKDAVLYYINAKAALDGVLDASNEAASDKRQRVQGEVARRTHKERGVIVPATMKMDDKPLYIINGEVAMFPDGSGVDVRNSSDSVIILDESGEYKFTSPDQIMSVGETIDPQVEIQTAYEAIDREQEAIISAATEGVPESPQTGLKTTENSVSEGEIVPKTVPSVENGQETALKRIPKDEQTGDPILTHESVDADTAWDAAVEFFGGDKDALGYVQSQITASKSEIGKAEKEVSKVKPTGSMIKYRDDLKAARNKVETAKGTLAKWEAIEEVQKRRNAEESARIAADLAAKNAQLHEEAVARFEEEQRVKAEKQAEQERIGTHAVNPKIKEKWDAAPKVDGHPDVITLPDGSMLTGHYVMTEAGAASASHDVNNAFEPTEGFPIDKNGQSVNDRDYRRDKDAQRLVQSMADAFDSRAIQTPVFVSKDGIVLSGNNRTMSGDIAAAQGTDGAYLEYLSKFGRKYGFTPEQVEGMKHARVVFVPDEDLPYDATTFSRFNAQEMKSQSKPEAAIKLGKIVDDAVFNRIVTDLNRYDRLSDFYADQEAAARTLRELVAAGVINDKQLPELRTGAALSAAGKELIENTLIGKVFQSEPDAVRQIISIPTLRQGVVLGLNEIATNRTLANKDYDLGRELSAAVDLVYRARTSSPDIYKDGMPVSPFGRQQGLFDDEYGDSRVTDATTLLLADLLNSGKPSNVRKLLVMYNNEASQSASGQADIFTGEVPTKENIIKKVNELFSNGTAKEKQKLVDAAIADRKQRAAAEYAERKGSEAVDETADADERGEGIKEREPNTGTTTRLGGKASVDQSKKEIVESEERDENGRPFVLTDEGISSFGYIDEESGLTPAPIKLSEGFQDETTGQGYGLLHIEAGHGIQIRAAGFSSVKEFVSFVANNYDRDNIRVGKRRPNGNGTFLLQVTDKHDNTLFIELSKDGSYWNVNSGGIFRKGYSNKKETVAKTEPQQPNNAVSGDSSLSVDERSGISSAEPNGESSVSNDKVNTLTSDKQGERPESSLGDRISEYKSVKAVEAERTPGTEARNLDINPDTMDYGVNPGKGSIEAVKAARESAEKKGKLLVEYMRDHWENPSEGMDEERQLREDYHAQLEKYADAITDMPDEEFEKYAQDETNYEELRTQAWMLEYKPETHEKFKAALERADKSRSRNLGRIAYEKAPDASIAKGKTGKRGKDFSLSEVRSDKDNHPVYNLIHHDRERGMAVVYNGPLLIGSKLDYEDDKGGRAVGFNGKEVGEAWNAPIDRMTEQKEDPIATFRLTDEAIGLAAAGLSGLTKAAKKEATAVIAFGGGEYRTFGAENWSAFLRGARRVGADEVKMFGQMVIATGDKGLAALLARENDGEATFRQDLSGENGKPRFSIAEYKASKALTSEKRLSQEEASYLISKMESNADVAPAIDLTPENWIEQFGEEGKVETPVGTVKMGENQFMKLFSRKRAEYFGMIRPTLTNPDVILEEIEPKEGAERDSKYLFIKTFVKPDGKRIVHFESVTVRKDGMEVSISSHEIKESAIKNKMQNDKILHLDKKLSPSSEVRLTETPHETEGPDLVPTSDNVSSADKVSTLSLDRQEKRTESSLRKAEGKENLYKAAKGLLESAGIEVIEVSEDEANRMLEKTDASRYSRSSSRQEKDSAYMKAVEEGDMETAARMVRETAEAAGYVDDSSYQGTSAFNGAAPYNGYDWSKEERKEKWDNGEFEGDYTLGDYIDFMGESGDHLDFLLNHPNGLASASAMGRESILALRQAIRKGERKITVYRSVPSEVKEGSLRDGDWVTPSLSYAKDNAAVHGWGRKYRVIEQTVDFDDLWWDGNDINEWGFDSGSHSGYKNTRNNRKLLDPVTYDDNGAVIPLSQRFNQRNSDIRYLRDGEGRVYGWTVGGKVYLNRDAMNPETPLHEYTHLWDEMVMKENPELWERGKELMKELMKELPLWDEVRNDPAYADIRDDEDEVASEVHSRLTGSEGARILEEIIAEAKKDGAMATAKAVTLVERIKAWLGDMFKALRKTLGKWSGKELEELTAEDFAHMTLRDLAEGLNPANEMLRGDQTRAVTEANPMLDDYHRGVRTREDVKTFDEVLAEAEEAWAEYGDLTYPDMDIAMLRDAKNSGRITIYSSKPIETGVFVTPSRMNAEDYAGGGKVYSKEVGVNEVAWTGEDEGQYAPESEKRSTQDRTRYEIALQRSLFEDEDSLTPEKGQKNLFDNEAIGTSRNREKKTGKWVQTSLFKEEGTPQTLRQTDNINGSNTEEKLVDTEKGQDGKAEDLPLVEMPSENTKEMEAANKAIEEYAERFAEICSQYQAFMEAKAEMADDIADRLEGELQMIGNILEDDLRRYYQAEGNSDEDALRMARDKAGLVRAEVTFALNKLGFMERMIPQEPDTSDSKAEDSGKGAYKSAAGELLEWQSSGNNLKKLKDGEFALVERQFAEDGMFPFLTGAGKIQTDADVAYLFRCLENSAIENAFAVLVKDGKPLIVHIGMGTSNMSPADIAAIRAAMDAYEADKVYFVHNHPSGNLRESPQDRALYTKIADMAGEKAAGAIIIDVTSGKYSIFDTGNAAEKRDMSAIEREDEQKHGVLSFSRQVYGKNFDPQALTHIRGSFDVAAFVSTQRLGERPKIGYLLLSRSNRIIGNLYSTHVDLSEPSALAKEIASQCVAHGAEGAILYGNVELDSDNLRGLRGELEKASGKTVNLLDVMHMDSKLGDGYMSARDEGIMEPTEGYSSQEGLRFRIREDEPPKLTGVGYKVFVLKDGKLYPPMVANPNGEATPVGVWLDADAAPVAGTSKTGRMQVKAGGKGTQGGSGKLAYRPGWHLGVIPYALQFNRKGESGEKDLFPANFVWAEVEYANDIDYQEEAMNYGYNKNGKFQHSYAGLPRIPVNGAYKYRTNPNPETDPWIITGAMKVNRLLTPSEVDDMVKAAGREPQKRQDGAVTDEQINELNAQFEQREREGDGAYSDEKLSYENDPWSKAWGQADIPMLNDIRDRVNAGEWDAGLEKAREYLNAYESSAEAKEGRVMQLSQKLNTPIRVISDEAEIKSLPTRRERRAKGWWSSKTGEVVVVLPNNVNVADVENTVVHEIVGHKGLQAFIGEERFDEFLGEVYDHASNPIRKQIDKETDRMVSEEADRLRVKMAEARERAGENVNSHYWDDMAKARVEAEGRREEFRREATEEYMADLAGRIGDEGFEKMSRDELTFWGKVKAKVQAFLDRFLKGLKIAKSIRLSDKDLSYILFKTWKNKRESSGDTRRQTADGRGGVFAEAEDVVRRQGTRFSESREYDLKKVRKEALEDRIEELFDRAVSGDLKGKPVEIGRLTEAGRQFLEKLSGKEMKAEISFVLNPSDLQHINRRHFGKNEKDSRNIPLKKEDIRCMHEILCNPDKVIYGEEIDGQHRGMFFFLKEAENGSYNLMEVYADRKGNLSSKSFFKSKEGVTQRAMLLNESSTLTSVTDGATLFDGAKLPIFFEYPKFDGEEDVIRFRDPGMGLDETITKMKADAAAANGADFKAKQDAMKAIGGNLSKLRQAMARQREYDIITVKSITDLAKILMDAGLLDDLSKYETKRILSAIKDAVGREDTSKQVQRLMDIMVDNQLRMGANYFRNLLKVKGSRVDARGIEVQGELDPDGQKIVQTVRRSITRTLEDIENMMSEATNRMDSAYQAVADEAALEYTGLQIARQFVEEIRESKNEEKDLRKSIDDLRAERKAEAADSKKSIEQARVHKEAGRMSEQDFNTLVHDIEEEERVRKAAFKQYAEATNDAIRQNKIERAEAYRSLSEQLGGVLGESVARAKAWREAEKERVNAIHHLANSDMQGRELRGDREDTRLMKLRNSWLVNWLLEPMSTLDQMLKMMGSKNPNGEGYMYNHFMRGWIDSADKEQEMKEAVHKQMDDKAAEIFGKHRVWSNGGSKKVDYTYSDLYDYAKAQPSATIKYYDGAEMREYEIGQGELLYLYAVDKMPMGRATNRRMGIDEVTMQRITDALDPILKEYSDWVQDELLPRMGDAANEVHKRMFGADMDAIENYFPFVRDKDALKREVENGQTTQSNDRISVQTGAIKKRVASVAKWNMRKCNFMDVLAKHVDEMCHWTAFAELNRDFGTLLSYNRLKQQVFRMNSAYGAGEQLWKRFQECCAIATDAYEPQRAKFDRFMVQGAKGVTMGKISLRVFTALKQTLSLPAFFGEVNLKYVAADLGTGGVIACKWAWKNMPNFRKRILSRTSGDYRLKENEYDGRIMKASSYGMLPNIGVDAWTIAVGSHGVYKTRKAKYLRWGMEESQAERRAVQDAELCYNKSQQSSEGPFMAPVQVDHTFYATSAMLFRNSSTSYTREAHTSARNLKRLISGEVSEEFVAKQILRTLHPEAEDAWTDDEWANARKNARREIRSAYVRNTVNLAMFGWVLPWLWRIGGVAPLLLLSTDDDEKRKQWEDATRQSMFAPVEGLAYGDVISDGLNMLTGANEKSIYTLGRINPILSDIMQAAKKADKDMMAAANDVINIIGGMAIGVNPQTITDWTVAILDATDDRDTQREMALFACRVLSVPQSQIEKIYFDELDMEALEASGRTADELINRYARYKMMREAPMTGWLRGKEERNKLEETKAGKARTAAKERLNRRTDAYVSTDSMKAVMEEYEATKARVAEVNKIRKQDEERYFEQLDTLENSPEFGRYLIVGDYKSEVDALTKEWLRAKTTEERDSCARAITALKRDMLKDLHEAQ